ncbi:MAG: DUF2029 domain-containing protein [Anaerolineae bacterium]|nr:DUF2029 domain-containing protein [Anaerolineae bacterium]
MQFMVEIKQLWRSSRIYRILLTATVVYAVLRLVVHGAYLAMMLFPQAGIMGGVPGWVGAEGPMIPDDLRIYLDAAESFQLRQGLYPHPPVDKMEFYQYAPSYALVFSIFLGLSPVAVTLVHTLLRFLIYGWLCLLWARIFQRYNIVQAVRSMAWTLPIWVLFSVFWDDLGYLNVYITMALLATLLINAVLRERLIWSIFWASVILQIKPQWAFAIAVPLLLGRYRFFFKLLISTVIVYGIVLGGVTLIAGISYGWEQHISYFRLLSSINGNAYPWREPIASFLGYNHSITQIIVYLLGRTPTAFFLSLIVRLGLLLPLILLGVYCLQKPAKRPAYEVPVFALDLAFALYLGVYIWMNVVWELSLGIAVFSYLVAFSQRKKTRYLVWVVFLPYALVDIWRLITFAVWGSDIILSGLYVATDPLIYVPWIMIVAIVFYGIVILQLWKVMPAMTSKKA